MKEKRKCQIPDCTDQARPSGLCNACYSWTHRMRYYSAGQLATYLYRQKRMASRIGVRFSKPYRLVKRIKTA